MNKKLTQEVVETTTEAAVAQAATGTTGGKKSALVIGATVVFTLGVGYGVYRLVKYISAKRKAKKAAAEAEQATAAVEEPTVTE